MSSGILDIPCLGRPFQLGMLYDCRNDRLVHSVAPAMLYQQATDQRPQTKSKFELISEDSFASKSFHLGMQPSLKLSVLMGFVDTAGSAKYFDDHKSFNKLQARVTLKFGSTSRLEEIATDKLHRIHQPTVGKKATHIVTGILYGAESFFVFDQEVAPNDNYQTVHENMKKVIETLPDTVTVADMSKVKCTVYGDFQLPANPTSFQDAAKVLKKLPKMAEISSKAVPKRVTLYPLSKLHSSAVKMVHPISPPLVLEVESFVETFQQLQVQCNDLTKMEVSSNFPAIQKQLSCFIKVLTTYKSNMIKQLADLLPRVRGGDIPEADMTQIFKENTVSPFKSQRMISWLNKKEREVNMLASYLKSMKQIPFVSSPSELDEIVHSFEFDFVVCFSLLITGEDDAYLQSLTDYLQAPQLKQGCDDALPQQWHEDNTIVQNMRSEARQFKDFFEANRTQNYTKFIVSSCVKLESSDNKVAVTALFKGGQSPEKFLPPSQPGKATPTKVTNDSIQLTWSSPKGGAESVQSYAISYHVENDPAEQWKVERTQGSGNTTMITQLSPKTKYLFRVHAQCEVGVSPESEISDPIETSPNNTFTQGVDETHMSSKQKSYPAVSNPKATISRPGKPNASKVTSNSIHLNWSTPESGTQNIEFYTVMYCRMDDQSSQWQTSKTQGAQKFATVSGLTAKVVYRFKVRAECKVGVSPDSELSDPIATSPPSTQGSPGKPTATEVTHNSVHLNWPGPESNNEGIKFYSVLYRRMDNPSAKWQTTKTQGSQNEVTVSGLAAKVLYCFKVRAECEDGVICPHSELSDPIATSPPPAPGRPGKPTASKVTHNSIHLNWPGPISGIEGVKFYSVLYRRMDNPTAQWQTKKTQGSKNEVTVSGLAAKVVYGFKVRAECEAGVSPESEMCDPIATSPPPVPGRPGKPTTSNVTHNSIHLNWPGSKSGIEGVTFYSVLHRRMDDPSAEWQTTNTQGPQREVTMSGLAANAVYCFKVRAECEAGVSSGSEMSEPIRTSHPPVPGRPGKPKASKVMHNTIDVNWSHPKSGAENVKCYTVSYCKASGSTQHWEEKQADGAVLQLTVGNLVAKTKYYFRVRAEGEAGNSNWSEVSLPIQTLSLPPPSQPSKPNFSNLSHDKVVLQWNKPTCSAQAIKYYTIACYAVEDHDLPAKWKTQKTADCQEKATVTELKPRAVYCFKVRAESDAGSSSYSESSDPIQLYAPPAPSQPGKPIASDDDIIHNHIFLKWSKPAQGGEYVKHYSISYRKKSGPENKWQTQLSDGARTTLSVSGLNPRTEYCFKVHAVSDSGPGKDSEVSTLKTKTKVRLAEGMLKHSAEKIKDGPPNIYKLRLQEVTVDEKKQLKKCAIGKPDPRSSPEEKVIMVLGATGAGKTTLINGMTNYLLGVEWEDEFRFKLIVDEGDTETSSDTAQAHSQTKWITSYTFHHQKGSPLPYTLTIIDTPGFGDTGGLERDRRITEQIKELFSMPPPECIDHLNAIGFVTQSSLARLTPTQKYIFDSILAVFGKDIASNIFMMATFADGGDPPVKAAIKAANIPSCDLFKFNNSSLYAGCSDMFGKMFWEMGLKSFEKFFAHLKSVETRSLKLTRQVLDEREQLEAIIHGLLPQIKAIMSTMDELQQEEKILEKLKLEASDLESKEFTYTVTTIHQRKRELEAGEYVTNCFQCNRTCHYPCRLPDDDSKWGCAAMNWPEAQESSVCQVCPGGCEWQKHRNNTFRIEDYEEEEERTLDDLLKRFETVKSDKNAVKTTVDKINKKVENLKQEVFRMICDAQQTLARLDEIALKPNPLNQLDYIDLLIESEKQECKSGFKQRLVYLQEARCNAEVIFQIKEGKKAKQDTPPWLMETFQKAREKREKKTKSFQHAPPPPPKKNPSKGKWWPFS